MECLYLGIVGGGFPSPAEHWRERALDIQEIFNEHPEATYYLQVRGDSMIRAGIANGDLLIVDRALEVQSGSIVVALVNGAFVVKRYLVRDDQTVVLLSAHPRYPPLVVTPQMRFEVWGTVSFVVRSLSPDFSLSSRLRRITRRGNV